MELRGYRRANKPIYGLFNRYYYNEGRNFVKEKMPPLGECGTMKKTRQRKRENAYDII